MVGLRARVAEQWSHGGGHKNLIVDRGVHLFVARFATLASTNGGARHLERGWRVETAEAEQVRPCDAASLARQLF